MPVLILDAHLKSALAAIRSLGSRGIGVIAGAPRPSAMGLHSRYVSRTFLYPSPLRQRKRFVEAVRRAAEASGTRPVLFTFSDATLLPLYAQREQLGEALLALYPGSPSSFATAFSKAAVLDLAAAVGVETPRTFCPARVDELTRSILGTHYPVVVKPRHSVTWRGDVATQNSRQFAFSAEEVRHVAEAIFRQSGEMPLVQEYLAGEELGVEFLCSAGEVLASFAHRRIRSLSPTGGSAVVKQAISQRYRRIGDHARRLVASLQWTGPVMIEFKLDRPGGRPKLLEINGRYWGSLPLAILAGVDFPWLHYLLATGEPVAARSSYQIGTISQHYLGDLKNLFSVLFRPDPMRPLVYPSRTQALRQFLFPPRPLLSDVAAAGDTRPAAVEVLDALFRACTRAASLVHLPVPSRERG